MQNGSGVRVGTLFSSVMGWLKSPTMAAVIFFGSILGNYYFTASATKQNTADIASLKQEIQELNQVAISKLDYERSESAHDTRLDRIETAIQQTNDRIDRLLEHR